MKQKLWRHNTQHKDSQHDNTRHYDIHHYDTKYNYLKNATLIIDDTQHNNTHLLLLSIAFLIVMASVVMLRNVAPIFLGTTTFSIRTLSMITLSTTHTA